jgi:hypothetical protein
MLHHTMLEAVATPQAATLGQLRDGTEVMRLGQARRTARRPGLSGIWERIHVRGSVDGVWRRVNDEDIGEGGVIAWEPSSPDFPRSRWPAPRAQSNSVDREIEVRLGQAHGDNPDAVDDNGGLLLHPALHDSALLRIPTASPNNVRADVEAIGLNSGYRGFRWPPLSLD